MNKIYDTMKYNDNLLFASHIKDIMQLAFDEVERRDLNETILVVYGYYESQPDVSMFKIEADVSMAAIFQWCDEYLHTLANIDDLEIMIYLK